MKTKLSRSFDAWMKKKGFTTQEFVMLACEATGSRVSFSTVSKWRCGMAKPQPFVADILRQKFGDCPIFQK